MTNQRLAFIVKTLAEARRRGARLNGKSALERELQAWYDEPIIQIAPEDNLNGCPCQPAPVPFEIEMNWPELNINYFVVAWKRVLNKRFFRARKAA